MAFESHNRMRAELRVCDPGRRDPVFDERLNEAFRISWIGGNTMVRLQP
jgi:hypothetical protein